MTTPLCSACKLRPCHRVWDSGRGKCGDCYALDPSPPGREVKHEIQRAQSGDHPQISQSDADVLKRGRAEGPEGQVESLSYDGPSTALGVTPTASKRCPQHGAGLVLKPADPAQPQGRQVWRCPWAGCAVVAAVEDEPEETKPALSAAARAARRVNGRRQAMAQENPKRQAVLAEGRTGKFTSAELAARHGVSTTYAYQVCWLAKVKLPKKVVQARAREKAAAAPPPGKALARTARAVQPARSFDPRAFERATGARAGNGVGLTIPFTAAVSAALWRGLPLELQHAILAHALREGVESAEAKEGGA